jgi:hypothetical protein
MLVCIQNKKEEAILHTATISNGFQTSEYSRLGTGRHKIKKAAISLASQINEADVDNLRISYSVKGYFRKFNKKDDLSECFLQLWDYK